MEITIKDDGVATVGAEANDKKEDIAKALKIMEGMGITVKPITGVEQHKHGVELVEKSTGVSSGSA